MSSSAARYFPAALGKATTSSDVQTEAVRAAPISSSATTSGEALIARICEGDKEALASLFRSYARMVHGVACRVLQDPSEADDLVQDIFLLIHRDCKKFDSSRGPAQFWILQMAYCRAISRRRYLTTRHYYARLDPDDVADYVEDPNMGPAQLDDSIDGYLDSGRLQKVFASLSEDQRQTLHLFFTEGYTFDEIASKLGQSRGNVKHHYFRGLERLRKELFGSKLPGERSI